MILYVSLYGAFGLIVITAACVSEYRRLKHGR